MACANPAIFYIRCQALAFLTRIEFFLRLGNFIKTLNQQLNQIHHKSLCLLIHQRNL